MSLRNVLLGYLDQPASGYDIKQAFERHLSHLWTAETSQIYGTLRSMEQAGLLTSVTEKSPRGPDRRVYRRTPDGDREFEAWLDADPELSHERLSVLSQIHFLSRSRDPQQTRAFLAQVRDRFVERLQQYEALRDAEESSARGSKDALFDNLALDLGLKTLRARVEWCDEAIQRLAALDQGEASGA